MFGSNYDTEAGISGLSEIHEPRVVYSGKGLYISMDCRFKLSSLNEMHDNPATLL